MGVCGKGVGDGEVWVVWLCPPVHDDIVTPHYLFSILSLIQNVFVLNRILWRFMFTQAFDIQIMMWMWHFLVAE